MGAGAGHIADMVARMKANNALRSKKSYFDIRKEFLKAANGKTMFYKEASPKELEKIRKQVIRNRKIAFYKLAF